MGRGRAKAKQTKVARKLKYSTTATDLERLRAELSGDRGEPLEAVHQEEPEDDEEADYDDPYADLYADDEDGA